MIDVYGFRGTISSIFLTLEKMKYGQFEPILTSPQTSC